MLECCVVNIGSTSSTGSTGSRFCALNDVVIVMVVVVVPSQSS